jgi:hypothetical protein
LTLLACDLTAFSTGETDFEVLSADFVYLPSAFALGAPVAAAAAAAAAAAVAVAPVVVAAAEDKNVLH